jgi:hypothetical protein
MLNLQDGVTDSGDPSIIVTSQFEEKPDEMSITDFIQSLVSGTITGSVWVGDPAVETPIAFSFPQRASTTAGDAPIVIRNVGGDDTYGYTAGIAVDDYFDYEDSNTHSYGSDEWTIALQPAGHISIAATDDQASENSADWASFTITPTGSAGAYALFTVSGTAICGGTLYGELTDPDADYVIDGAEAMPGEPGKFKAYFNSYSQVAQVNIIPLNDADVEGAQDVQLTLAADEPPLGTCPAYAAPPLNGPGLPAAAAANLVDLVAGPPTDPNPPSAALMDQAVTDLNDEDPQTRDLANAFLSQSLADHPIIDSYLDDKLMQAISDGGPTETISRLKTILGPVRFRIGPNSTTITASLRFDPGEGISTIEISQPVPDANVNWSRILTASISTSGGPSASIAVDPLVAINNLKVTFQIRYLDVNGNEVGGRGEVFAMNLYELWSPDQV